MCSETLAASVLSSHGACALLAGPSKRAWNLLHYKVQIHPASPSAETHRAAHSNDNLARLRPTMHSLPALWLQQHEGTKAPVSSPQALHPPQ